MLKTIGNKLSFLISLLLIFPATSSSSLAQSQGCQNPMYASIIMRHKIGIMLYEPTLHIQGCKIKMQTKMTNIVTKRREIFEQNMYPCPTNVGICLRGFSVKFPDGRLHPTHKPDTLYIMSKNEIINCSGNGVEKIFSPVEVVKVYDWSNLFK